MRGMQHVSPDTILQLHGLRRGTRSFRCSKLALPDRVPEAGCSEAARQDDARDLASKTMSFVQRSRGALSEAGAGGSERLLRELPGSLSGHQAPVACAACSDVNLTGH